MAPLIFISFWVGPFSPYNAVLLGAMLLVASLAMPNGILSLVRPSVPQANAGSGDAVVMPEPDHAAPAARPAPCRIPAPTCDHALVRIASVSKSFGGLPVLRDIDLALPRGALVGLVGPNGSGKSTLLNVLSGYYRVSSGRIEMEGKLIAGRSVSENARSGISRTFQIPQLIPTRSTLENIELGLVIEWRATLLASLLRLPASRRQAAERRSRALTMFQQLDLPLSVLAQPASALSLGLKRVVEIGRAAVSQPKLLLLDEPAAGLDDIERNALGRLLRSLADTGMTILVVEHNVPFIRWVCDEIVLLEDGRITARAAAGGDIPTRLAAYLGHDATAHTPITTAA